MHHFLAKLSAVLVAYGPVGIFFLAMLDSAGVPLPGALDLLFLDIAVHSTQEPWRAYASASIAVIGSLAGNLALFHAVRHGHRLFRKEEPPPAQKPRFREWFHRYGLATVFIPAVVPLAPLPLKVFVVSAALFRTPLRRFVPVIVAARVIRYFGMAWLGLQLGADARGFLARNGWTIAGAILAMMAVGYALSRVGAGRRAAAPAGVEANR